MLFIDRILGRAFQGNHHFLCKQEQKANTTNMEWGLVH